MGTVMACITEISDFLVATEIGCEESILSPCLSRGSMIGSVAALAKAIYNDDGGTLDVAHSPSTLR